MEAPGVDDLSRGEELHASVGAERWCVTRRDLRDFRREVVGALERGEMVPTAQDDFDPKDKLTGPTIYTVVSQLIKPITARAGGMSWALMRHPAGLQCDLFVTHAWQEGIFEFIEKVLASWPRSSRHAWCCMLAMPQNLNIASMIAFPSASPFACALAFAPCLLVVPNHRGSIYTRLWCVYEAFLAYQWDKIVISAGHSPRWRILQALPLVLFCFAAGAVFGSPCGLPQRCFVVQMGVFVSYALMLCSMAVSSPFWWRLCNCLGSLWSGAYFFTLYRMPEHVGDTCFKHLETGVFGPYRTWQIGCTISAAIYFALGEIDRVRHDCVREEAAELTAGYSGTVRNASCSSPADAEKIMAEVTCTNEVDRSLEVLIATGMSTASLREAADRGVDLECFSHRGTSFCAFIFSMVPVALDDSKGLQEYGFILVPSLWLVYSLQVVWLSIQLFGRTDRKTWAYLVAQKVIVTVVWPIFLIALVLLHNGDVEGLTLVWTLPVNAVGWFVVVLLSLAHVHRVARVPYLGRAVAQLLAARSIASFRKVWATAAVVGSDGGSTPANSSTTPSSVSVSSS